MENRTRRGGGKRPAFRWFRSDDASADSGSARVPFRRNTILQVRLIGVAFVVAVTFLLMPVVSPVSTNLKIGEVAPRDIKAPFSFDVEARATTDHLRDLAAAEISPVYDFDLKGVRAVESAVERAFSDARTSKAGVEETAKMFQSRLGVVLSLQTIAAMRDEKYDPSVAKAVIRTVDRVMERGIVADKDVFNLVGEKGLVIRSIGERRESYVADASSVLDMPSAERLARREIEQLLPDSQRRRAAAEIVEKLLTPNLTFNPSETELRRKEAMASIRPLRYHIKRGEVILRAGERVTFAEEPILQELAWAQRLSRRVETGFGLFLIVSIVLFIFYRDLFRYKRGLVADVKHFVLLGILMAGTLSASRLTYFLLDAAMDRYPTVDPGSIIYALPAAVGSLLTVILFDIHIALVFSFIVSMLMGILIPEHPFFALFTFVGSIVASFSVLHCDRRSQLLRAGLYVGLVNAVMVSSLDLYRGEMFATKGLLDIAFAFSGGLVVAVVGSGFLPLFESLFGITTDIKLLELGNRDRPLLRKLELNTPGTYHHSMMVSSLAESGAAAIGANPLLARVSAYYHDIGKMTKPEYFIENQLSTINRHDRLSPNMSALIIMSHVKEGIELGKEARLPAEIIDAIPQHHGTRLIKYFYEKAKKNQDATLPPVKEEDFRYPGPKPKSRVTALIMMADAVEASSRVLTNPTPGRIKALVTQTLTNIFLDGQLDETDLTLKDLKTIVESFTKVLTGIFHHRIEYPGWGLPDYGEMGHEDFDKKRPEALQAARRERFKGG